GPCSRPAPLPRGGARGPGAFAAAFRRGSFVTGGDTDLSLRVHVLWIDGHAALEVLERRGRIAGELVHLADEVVRGGAALVELQRLVEVSERLDHRDLLVRQGEEARISTPGVELALLRVRGDRVVERVDRLGEASCPD